jgi:hypothetical protein
LKEKKEMVKPKSKTKLYQSAKAGLLAYALFPHRRTRGGRSVASEIIVGDYVTTKDSEGVYEVKKIVDQMVLLINTDPTVADELLAVVDRMDNLTITNYDEKESDPLMSEGLQKVGTIDGEPIFEDGLGDLVDSDGRPVDPEEVEYD